MSSTAPPLNPTALREQFPILRPATDGQRIVYLDSAASSQKPQPVLEAMEHYYREDYANVHRGVYKLAERSTEAYEMARQRIARFFSVEDEAQIIFVRNTSEAINLVATAWGRANLGPDDMVVTTEMEHHSNLVPWQLITEQTGATLKAIPINGEGLLQLDVLDEWLATGQVRMVAVTQASNMLGTINPVEQIIERAHAAGALVLIDGAQAAPHMTVDLTALDVDFYACSGHKMCGPMGSGMLYGKRELLEAMPPYQGGGEMIRVVEIERSTWADIPAKFEAGTPSVADAVGFGAACEYLSSIGMDAIHAHEQELVNAAWNRLSAVPGLTIYGPGPEQRGGAISFNVGSVHPHDVASILDEHGVCIRAGHHCTQPLHHKLGIDASARASFYLYNTTEDVDRLVEALGAVRRIFDRESLG